MIEEDGVGVEKVNVCVVIEFGDQFIGVIVGCYVFGGVGDDRFCDEVVLVVVGVVWQDGEEQDFCGGEFSMDQFDDFFDVVGDLFVSVCGGIVGVNYEDDCFWGDVV